MVLGAGAVFAARAWSLSPVDSVTSTHTVSTSEVVTVVVSSSLASKGDCHDHYTDGCDLFSAHVDLSTGEVTDVKQLTSGGAGEIFPVLSRDGESVYYTESDENGDSAMVISIQGGEARVLLDDANRPFPTADGSQVYVNLTDGFFIASLDLLNPDAVRQKIPGVTGAHEVHISPQGLIAFYRLITGESRGSGTAQAMLYLPSTEQTVEVSDADGTAHCFWNYDGSALFCNNRRNGGILSYPVSKEGVVGESSVAISFPSVEALSEADSDFDEHCVETSVEYGSFCDATHVVLTAACLIQKDGELDQDFAQTVILDMTSGEYSPLGASIAKAYGNSEGTTWTGTCLN